MRLLETWGVRVQEHGRQAQALSTLLQIADDGLFAPYQRGDALGMRALELALDLRVIAETLPLSRIADLRKDIEACLNGPLDPSEDERKPLQLQTQLCVRAAIEKVGVETDQPRHSGRGGRKKPDLLVQQGTLPYAIEIKRPTKEWKILDSASTAAEQLSNAGYKGGMVIDITDTLRSVNADEADESVLKWAGEVARLFWREGTGATPGMSHVLMVLVMARPNWVVEPKEDNALILVHSTSAGWAFGMREGTLDHRRGVWLRQTVSRGLNMLGFTSSDLSPEASAAKSLSETH